MHPSGRAGVAGAGCRAQLAGGHLPPRPAVPTARAAAPRLLDPRLSRDPTSFRIVKRVILAALVVHVTLALLSGWRAWVQVRRLELDAPAGALRTGSRVEARVLTSARTSVTVTLALVQGAAAETLGVRVVPANRDPASDPRPRRAALAVTLGDAALARFRPGPATLRAVAVGRSQWLRVPPPTVRETSVEIAPRP
jgi:hypothetical protein